MLRAREVNWGQVPSCVPIGRTFQGRDSTPAGAHKVDFGSFLCCTGDKSKGGVHDATWKIEVIFSLVHETHARIQTSWISCSMLRGEILFAQQNFSPKRASRGKQRHQHFPVSCSLNTSQLYRHLTSPTSLSQNLARFLIGSAVRKLTCR